MRKINIEGTLFCLLTLIIIILSFFELNNLIMCISTQSNCVMICDSSLRLFIFILSISIWSCWTFWNIIDTICLEWNE